MNRLNKSLLLIRKFHHITQTDLADKISISKSYLSEIESGKKTVSIDLLDKYSSLFNIPTSSLLLFSENIEPSNSATKVQSFAANKIVKILNWISDVEESGFNEKKAAK